MQDPWGPGCVTISAPQHPEARAWYVARHVPVFAYSSLARGLFSGRATRANAAEILDGAARTAYAHECNFQHLDRLAAIASERGLTMPQVALAWLMQQPLQVHALVGAANREELANSIAGAETILSADDVAWLDLRGARAARG